MPKNSFQFGPWFKTIALFGPLLCVLSTSSNAWAGPPDAFTKALEKGPIYAGLAAFVGGLGVSLTPCVYPMIAVTVSVFGAKQAKSRVDAMSLSTIFVLGIAAMFTPLGVAAGLTGGLFGSALSNPWVVSVIALVFLVLAASMFGVFEFVLPSGLTNRAATMGGVGYGGAFLLGLVSGIVAAPCTGPVLTGILLWIGRTQSPLLGAIAMFAFSLGLGVPFWIVGTFAVRLPKTGKWVMYSKSFFGAVMIVVALYVLKNGFPQVLRVIPLSKLFPIAAAALVFIGLAMGAIQLGFDEGRGRAIRKSIGLGLLVLGSISAITWFEIPKGHLPWIEKESEALAKARLEKSPLIIDFTADWCGACKKIASQTFSDPAVQIEAERFVLLKVDATHDDDPAVEAIQKRYGVVGLPTVIVLDSSGKEQSRFTDFVAASPFYRAIQGVK